MDIVSLACEAGMPLAGAPFVERSFVSDGAGASHQPSIRATFGETFGTLTDVN